jgi:hypothetical protein
MISNFNKVYTNVEKFLQSEVFLTKLTVKIERMAISISFQLILLIYHFKIFIRHSRSFWDRVGYDHLVILLTITKFPKGN